MATFRWPTWDPFGTLRYVQQQMERMTGVSIFGDSRSVGGGSYPPVNVLNGPDDIVVECEVPGVKREDIDLSITGETLVVKGVKKPLAGEEKVEFQRRERGIGDFSRTIVLPDKVEADRVEASLSAGVLSVRLPKSEAARPKQIHVK